MDRHDLLTRILRKAVPSFSFINSAYIARSKLSDGYYIGIERYYVGFWRAFQQRYPGWRNHALQLRGNVAASYCPTFETERQLMLWLCRTLSLPDSMASLLVVSCQRKFF